MNTILTTLLFSLLQIYPVVLDDSPTRVESDLDPKMEIMGTLKPKSVSEISTSRWTVDCGGMDREHADWRAAEVEELVDVILFMCSDNASFITGTNHVVDGGRLCMYQKTY